MQQAKTQQTTHAKTQANLNRSNKQETHHP